MEKFGKFFGEQIEQQTPEQMLYLVFNVSNIDILKTLDASLFLYQLPEYLSQLLCKLVENLEFAKAFFF